MCTGQMRASNPLELDLQRLAVSSNVLGTESGFSGRAQLLAISPAPISFYTGFNIVFTLFSRGFI